ncbi:MAG: PQQ-dependent sugar dehydrogenase [Hyphomonadaceae bacterium]
MRVTRRSALLAGAGAALAFSACDGGAQPRGQAAGGLSVDTLAEGLDFPWSLAFLPDGAALIVEKHGQIRLWRDGRAARVQGGPQNVFHDGQSGLHDIALDPRFVENGLVYISFVEGPRAAHSTALFRARFDGERFIDGQVIFRATARGGRVHPGGRMLFLPDESLLLFIGVPDDLRDRAQDMGSHLGKLLRLDREGRPPTDNPFMGRAGALPEIFTLGHRNAMGLARDPRTGEIWLHENGPRGGDELNLIRPGANYGWPRVTHGVEYSGLPITDAREAPGMESAAAIWTPSIAPSGMAIYAGEAFPDWRNDLFIGMLRGQHLRRVRVRDGAVVEQEILLADLGRRIRDVREGPDGFLYLLTDYEDGALLRVRPAI